jgi:hypothetical protein
MQRRIRKIANFFAFNLLFFALYLNFIHKEKSVVSASPTVQQTSAAFSGKTTASNPVQTEKKEITPVEQMPVKLSDNGVALKLSIN